MKVDPGKPRKVLVIYGVQLGEAEQLNQHEQIAQLISNRLGNLPVQYETALYNYEDLNDSAQSEFSRLLQYVIPLAPGAYLVESAIDLIGDVVTSKLNTSTAALIRENFKNKIMDIFEQGNPCYVVAHSLGSIYAFDVINELMLDPELFQRHSRKTWPVQGLVTIGSPIGLSLFSRNRLEVTKLGAGDKWFRWINYWDRNDPIVSGKILGQTLNSFEIAENYLSGSPEQGWVIRDISVDTGKVWLMAHTAYWENPMVGDGLVNLITN